VPATSTAPHPMGKSRSPSKFGFSSLRPSAPPLGSAEEAEAEGGRLQPDFQPTLGALGPGESPPLWGAGRDRAPPGARQAVVKIRQASPLLPSHGTRRFAFATAEPMCYPKVDRALMWPTYHEVKAAQAKSTPQFRFSTVSR
jgi:hypothetical protein